MKDKSSSEIHLSFGSFVIDSSRVRGLTAFLICEPVGGKISITTVASAERSGEKDLMLRRQSLAIAMSELIASLAEDERICVILGKK